MKKLLTLMTLGLLSFVALNAKVEDAVEKGTKAAVQNEAVFGKAKELINAMQKGKEAWFDYKKSKAGAMTDLLKKQHAEHFAEKAKLIDELEKGTPSEEIVANCYKNGLEAAERHLEEWKKLCDTFHEKAEFMYKSQMSALKALK